MNPEHARKPKFAAISGLDATGKTTLADVLAKELQKAQAAETYDVYCARRGIGDPYRLPATTIMQQGAEELYDFFLLSAAYKSAVIRRALDEGVTIIAARWVTDVHAHCQYAGATPRQTPPDVLTPDITILLVANEAVRQERLRSRPNPTPYDLVPNEPGTRTAFFDSYFRQILAEQAVIVDTSEHDPLAAARYIIDHCFNESTGQT